MSSFEAQTSSAWRDDALCAQVDPEMFFPDSGQSAAQPKKICAQCDVAEQCLAYALANPELNGIWGGKTHRERRAIIRRQREQSAESSQAYVTERDRTILQLKAQGHTLNEIAEITHITPRSVSRAVKRHLQDIAS